MGDNSPIRIEQGASIDWIVLDRPGHANALSSELLDQFSGALRRLAGEGAPVIGIRGAGRGFSAGVDLGEYNSGATPVEDAMRLRRNVERWLEIWNHPKPVIAAIHGYCVGVAAQLPVFADMTIVAEDARISEPKLPLGGGYVAPAWTHLVGAKRAKEISFLPGNEIDGRTAAEWGWANAAVPAGELVACVEALAERMALIPAPVLAMKKRSVNRAMEAGGFLAGLNAISETDALLHFEPAVVDLRRRVADEDLKTAIAGFAGPSSAAIFQSFQKDKS
jgi:enoyl-CoA hydratase